ncbi:MAG: 23S rRNA (adenine(2503)-C(2))-methyltransferase RlmN [Candidatus Eisenbacteria bacterium]
MSESTVPAPPDERIPLLGKNAAQMREDGPLSELPAFRARQIAHWLYARGETRFSAMSDLSLGLRERLEGAYSLDPDPILTMRRAQDDEAAKFLLKLADGKNIETVLINSPNRRTICVSSQVGCAYGCDFCATAKMGPGRNLTVKEILSQLFAVQRFLEAESMGPLDNVVFMGMGEPLQNLDNVLGALRLMQDPDGIGLGWRRITVSTVGLVPQIRALADSDVPVRLAYSLSATTDETRTALMPVNKKYPFREVFEAIRYFQARRRIRATLEYVLLDGVNDTTEDATRLAAYAKELRCKVNLIVYNPHPLAPYRPSPHERIESFMKTIYPLAPSVTLRYSRGRDILAACGQLSTQWDKG